MVVDLLGVPISALTKKELIAQVIAWCQPGERRTVAYANAHSLNLAGADGALRGALIRADLVYSDGIGVVWAARWLSAVKFEKITGHDWIGDLCLAARDSGKRLCLLGGRAGVAERARQQLCADYPGLQILAAWDGFEGADDGALLAQIERLRPDLLLVGMGSPRQELWIDQQRAQLNVPVCWSVGALFDLVAGVEPQVPRCLNRLGLEWLWRLMADPSGKWRRYLLGNPLFLARILAQKMGQR